MSWVVEQSENTSAINVHGDTITCTKDGCGSPINVMYKDPADRNGQYFWQLEFKDLNDSTSVGLTTDKGFQAGWGLKAMNYLGNLSDGGSLLVQAFGEPIKGNDKVGLLLQLSDADSKIFIFHNDKPLGLAFHVASPYPKPLYPVVSFNGTGKVKISRSQQAPTSLNRSASQFNGVEGHWKIVNYQQHPECAGIQFEIKKDGQNSYDLHTRVVNGISCRLQHSSGRWSASPGVSTMMAGPPEQMRKESVINKLVAGIQNLEVHGNQQLNIHTNDGQQIQLERFTKEGPAPVTQNIFH